MLITLDSDGLNNSIHGYSGTKRFCEQANLIQMQVTTWLCCAEFAPAAADDAGSVEQSATAAPLAPVIRRAAAPDSGRLWRAVKL